MDIKVLNESEFGLWDEFVNTSPQGSIFSTGQWLKAVGGSCEIIAALKKDKIEGGIALNVRQTMLGAVAGTPPMTPYTGILLPPSRSDKPYRRESADFKVLDELVPFLKSRYQEISFSSSCNFRDGRVLKWNGFSQGVNYTYHLATKEGESLPKRLEQRTRTDCNKAKRNGMLVDESSDMDTFYPLYEASQARQGRGNVVSKKKMLGLFSMLGGTHIRIFVAKDSEGMPQAGAVTVSWKNMVYYLFGGGTDNAKRSGAASFVLLSAIEAYGPGKTVDLVGAKTRDIAFFKRGFGGDLKPQFTFQYRSQSLQLARTMMGLLKK